MAFNSAIGLNLNYNYFNALKTWYGLLSSILSIRDMITSPPHLHPLNMINTNTPTSQWHFKCLLWKVLLTYKSINDDPCWVLRVSIVAPPGGHEESYYLGAMVSVQSYCTQQQGRRGSHHYVTQRIINTCILLFLHNSIFPLFHNPISSQFP